MGHYATVWDQKEASEIIKDWNGVDQVLLRNPHGASAKISLHGGQVISWRNEQGEELLFTSNKILVFFNHLLFHQSFGIRAVTNMSPFSSLDDQEIPSFSRGRWDDEGGDLTRWRSLLSCGIDSRGIDG
ncbi:Galactose mutarotase-like domain superfamily [Arabidopsis suecica]|uniref:Galactose mutarotase-like domain superfamily n=1 Tax=Arabidopsis suecica TaxID=45249 RepID=A0A8T2B976_ARASU|nr:Galactose mutarotase-like domain superfamily [Arabidopsis suecica]